MEVDVLIKCCQATILENDLCEIRSGTLIYLLVCCLNLGNYGL